MPGICNSLTVVIFTQYNACVYPWDVPIYTHGDGGHTATPNEDLKMSNLSDPLTVSMKQMINERREKLERNFADGWVTSDEYALLKAELMAVSVEMDLIVNRFSTFATLD